MFVGPSVCSTLWMSDKLQLNVAEKKNPLELLTPLIAMATLVTVRAETLSGKKWKDVWVS